MKFHLLLSILLTVLFLVSCNADIESDSNINELDQMNELLEGLDKPDPNDPNDWRNYFEMAVPAPMLEMNELNPSAIAQYGYVQEVAIDSVSSVVKEHYLIVLMERKAEIEGYPNDRQIDVLSYREDAMNALLGNGNRFKTISKDSTVEKLHGMDCVRNELERIIEGRDGTILLYYQLAIVEGEDAFYQILTWCLNSQREDFEYEMEKIINSFKEV